MKTNTDQSFDRQPDSLQAPTVKAQALKLGLDVHVDRYVVVRQMDGNTPPPAQSFTPAAFLAWVKTQFALAERVYACYEAGPFGYGLHRALTALGATNYVVRPRDWDEYGQKVKTDRRDAARLTLKDANSTCGSSVATP
jgi:transposase